MSQKSIELRADRGVISKEMNELVEKNATLEGANLARWKELDEKQKRLKEQIDAIEGSEALDKELREVKRPGAPAPGSFDPENRANPMAAAQTHARELAASDNYKTEFTSFLRSGRVSPLLEEMRTYTAMGITGGDSGAQFVPVGFSNVLESKLKAVGGIRPVAQVLSTQTGNTINYPTQDDTANNGSWLAEQAPANQTNGTTGNIVITSNLGSSDQVLVSVQLVQDSFFDIDSLVATNLGLRLGRLTNLAYTKGSGSGQPKGLITSLVADGTRTVLATGANSTNNPGMNEVNSIGSDDLDSLISAIDPAYRGAAQFQANQATWDVLRKVKDGFGRSLWSAGLAENVPDTIRGYKFSYNQAMDVIAPSANSVVFGDFTKYVVRDVLGFTLVRYNELYMPNKQIGFEAYLRTDGQCIQTAAFSMLQHRLS